MSRAPAPAAPNRRGSSAGRRRLGRRRFQPRADRSAARHGCRGSGHDLDLAVHLPRAAEAGRGAPLDHRLRQQPPPRRAAGAAPQRAGGERDRARPPRLAGPGAAGRGRGAAQARRDPLPGGDLVARARHRHGRSRSGDPGREPEVRRSGATADRPCRPRARGDLEGPDLPEVPRRPARVGGGRGADARRGNRGDGHPEEPARRARPADRGGRGAGGDRGGRAARPRPRRVSIRRPLPRAARERPRHALGPLPLGRVRGAETADRLGPHRRHDPGARGCPPARRHERRHYPRPRPLRRPPRRRRRPRRRARRGDGVRGPRRADLPARRLQLADRGDHTRPRAGHAGAWRARSGAVLEGRGRRPAVRAR